MSKNIVICSDGTGNTAIKGRGTNVFKLFEAVDLNGHRSDARQRRQIAFYDDGVGSEGVRWWRVFSGATGYGLSRNVRQLYTELSRVYEPGDDIYLFGFSRGAFTVRTLAGLITACGIVDTSGGHGRTEAALKRTVKRAYRVYRGKYRAWLTSRLLGDADRTDGFRRECCHQVASDEQWRARIKFVGVWDTVDAVGLPFGVADLWNRLIYQFKFPTTSLSPLVESACHALALDDERASFRPVLWDERDEHTSRAVAQVWFAGVHCNVGGGYPQQGMSLVPLDWMMSRAELRGLRFSAPARSEYGSQQSVADRLYDSRAGLGMFYRWQPRDVTRLARAKGINRVHIHVSAIERIAQGAGGYAPSNIPNNCEVVSPETPSLVDLTQVAARVQSALQDPEAPTRSSTRGWLMMGFLSYLIFIAGIGLAVLLATIETMPEAWARATQSGPLVLRSLPWEVLTNLLTSKLSVGVLLGSLVLGWLLSTWSDTQRSDQYSGFWHRHRRAIQKALSLYSA